MTSYYVNNNSDNEGDHEVHEDGCAWLAMAHSVSYLGDYTSSVPAVAKAKQTYITANGCKHCSPFCHTS